MKKRNPAIWFISCVAILLISIMISYAGSDTAIGRLVYYEYDAYPYVLEMKDGQIIALDVDLNKTLRNTSVDKFLGKTVQVTGPVRVISEMTELHGLKIIDIRPGKGTIKPLR